MWWVVEWTIAPATTRLKKQSQQEDMNPKRALQAVVGLSPSILSVRYLKAMFPNSIRVAIDSACTTDIDYVSRLSVLDSEIRRGCSDKSERGGVM